jgi:hypothetical protein
VNNAIGTRRAPHPQGRAGFVRIDTVHPKSFGSSALLGSPIWRRPTASSVRSPTIHR